MCEAAFQGEQGCEEGCRGRGGAGVRGEVCWGGRGLGFGVAVGEAVFLLPELVVVVVDLRGLFFGDSCEFCVVLDDYGCSGLCVWAQDGVGFARLTAYQVRGVLRSIRAYLIQILTLCRRYHHVNDVV